MFPGNQKPKLIMKRFSLASPISVSNHCQSRLSQRGISEEALIRVIQNGEVIHKQGLKFHFLTKSRCKRLEICIEEVKDLMVITNLECTEVVTCYKNPNAIHEVKKKSKRLSRTPKYRSHNLHIIHQFKNQQVA